MSALVGALMLLAAIVGQNSGEEIISLTKCCSLGEIYNKGNGTCVPQDTGDNTTEWFDLLPNDANFVIKWKKDVVPESGQCSPGFEYRELVFNPKTYGVFRVELGKTTKGAWIYDAFLGYYFVDVGKICFDGVQDGGGQLMLARMCVLVPCIGRVCVQKCCPYTRAFNEQFFCDKTSYPLKMEDHLIFPSSIHKAANDKKEGNEAHVLDGRTLNCTEFLMFDSMEEEEHKFHAYVTGTLYIPSLKHNFTKDQYCLEKIIGDSDMVARVCAGDYIAWPKEPKGYVTKVIAPLVVMSEVCLVVTFVVYSSIPDLRNLQGKKVMSYVGSLFWAYLFLVIIQLGGLAIAKASKGLCKALGFIVHYFFMVSFFWLSSMSFDIWRTFWSMKGRSDQESKSSEKKKFFLSSLYAWAVPLPISCVTILMELAPWISSSYIKPGFANNGCWFASKKQLWPYMGPMGVVLLANVVFFILTTVKLVKLMRDTKILQNVQDNNQNRKRKHRFWLYVKLLLVMGVTWVCQLISWMTDVPLYVEYGSDILNSLQGVFVFVIFVCKKKVLGKLNKKTQTIRQRFRSGDTNRSASETQDSSDINVTNDTKL